MKAIQWLHTADLHLDAPLVGWKGSKEQMIERYEEHRNTFRKIVSLVEDKKIPFLFIAGDFLEHGYVTRSTIQFVLEQLERIPQTQVLITPGNHDPYMDGSYYLKSELWPKHVHIFGGEWEEHTWNEYQLKIVGRGFTSYEERDPQLPTLDKKMRKNILISHGDLISQGQRSHYFPIYESSLTKLEFDYVALGHIHKAKQIQLKNARKTLIRYPGSPEAHNWKELGKRSITMGTLDKKGIRIEEQSLHNHAYELCEVDVTPCQTKEDVIQIVTSKLEMKDPEQYITILLQGRSDHELSLKEHEIWFKQKLSDLRYNRIFLEDQTIPDIDLDEYRRTRGFVALYIQNMEERIKEESDLQRRKLLELALYRGLEALLVKELVHQ